MTILAASGAATAATAVAKTRLPSSIAMLIIVLGLFCLNVGITGTEKLKMRAVAGVNPPSLGASLSGAV